MFRNMCQKGTPPLSRHPTLITLRATDATTTYILGVRLDNRGTRVRIDSLVAE